MTNNNNLEKNKKAAYQSKEPPFLKRLLNKILGPIRFF